MTSIANPPERPTSSTTTRTPRPSTASNREPSSASQGGGSDHRAADRLLLTLSTRITDRDRLLCRTLRTHRVLTTGQITDLAFTGARRTRQRLAELHALDVLDRFRPRSKAGSAPHHWILAPAGARLLAAEDGADPHSVTWRRDTAAALAGGQRLNHLVGVNGTFTALIRAARTHPASQLVEWWSEARCAAEWGTVVRPDGYGVWAQDGGIIPFLLEYDNGTERQARLADKLPGYAALAREAGHPTWLLFRFPTSGRETAARPVLTHRNVPVATAVLAAGDDPSAAIWLTTSPTPGRRLRLLDLGDPAHPPPGAAPATR